MRHLVPYAIVVDLTRITEALTSGYNNLEHPADAASSSDT